jgi:hypothetical protein
MQFDCLWVLVRTRRIVPIAGTMTLQCVPGDADSDVRAYARHPIYELRSRPLVCRAKEVMQVDSLWVLVRTRRIVPIAGTMLLGLPMLRGQLVPAVT